MVSKRGTGIITGRTHASQKQVFDTINLLKEHLEIIVEQEFGPEGEITTKGLVRYKDRHSDETIGALVKPTLKKTSVMNIRSGVFGVLHEKRPPAELDQNFFATIDMLTRLQHLEARDKEREEWIVAHVRDYAKLTDRYNKLVETLALNQVAKVRHLATTFVGAETPMALKAAAQ